MEIKKMENGRIVNANKEKKELKRQKEGKSAINTRKGKRERQKKKDITGEKIMQRKCWKRMVDKRKGNIRSKNS